MYTVALPTPISHALLFAELLLAQSCHCFVYQICGKHGYEDQIRPVVGLLIAFQKNRSYLKSNDTKC